MVSGYRVYPFLGVVDTLPAWRPQVTEVAAVLELSLADVARSRRMRPLWDKGVPVPTVSFTVDGHLVWGATARILDQLLKRVRS